MSEYKENDSYAVDKLEELRAMSTTDLYNAYQELNKEWQKIASELHKAHIYRPLEYLIPELAKLEDEAARKLDPYIYVLLER